MIEILLNSVSLENNYRSVRLFDELMRVSDILDVKKRQDCEGEVRLEEEMPLRVIFCNYRE